MYEDCKANFPSIHSVPERYVRVATFFQPPFAKKIIVASGTVILPLICEI